MVNYRYNSWGKLVALTDTTTEQVGEKNPFRYRGYYYDGETGWYYLNSRYYDPEVSRFVNADDPALLLNGEVGLSDKNLYAYCENNPIMRMDDVGDFWNIVSGAIIGAAISAGMELVSQAISSRSTGKKINWESVAVAAIGGAVSGGLAATGIGLHGQQIGNAIIGGVGEAYNQWRSGSSLKMAVTHVGLAAYTGYKVAKIGGPGIRAKGSPVRRITDRQKGLKDNVRRAVSNPKGMKKDINKYVKKLGITMRKEVVKTTKQYMKATAVSILSVRLRNLFFMKKK